ncbi:MAG: hypothetical protein LBD75_04495 [Candidatus Peribacteria bacterium]|nr:hypothetical protein [Candidatus Peribacteria bacterium]
MVIGEIGGTSGNQIAREAINALIAGGSRNTINSAGINASISSFFA